MSRPSARLDVRTWTWLLPAIGVIAVVAIGWLLLRPSGDERVARRDAASLGESIAEYVVVHGALPRVGVTTQTLEGGDVVWGADYLVGDRAVPRVEPERARPFFVVGSVDRWCVEVQYLPPAIFVDSVMPEWVAARGSGGTVGRVVSDRCGSGYTLGLSPVTETGVPQPGSSVEAARAVAGTCFTELVLSARSTARLEVVDCRDPHFAEVYHAGEIDASDYARFEESAAEQCAAAFRTFVGVPHNVSAFSGEPSTVERRAWAGGDAKYSCVLFLGNEDYPLVGSARDSRR